MRTQVRISFGVRDRTPEEVDRILAAVQQPHPGHTAFSFDLDSEAPELAALRSLLEEYGIEWREAIDRFYSKSELLDAPLILLLLERDEVDAGPSTGNTYDFSEACSDCGTGARPVPPYKLDRSKIRFSDMFQTYGDEWFVSEELARSLRRFSGLELLPTQDAGSGEQLPWLYVVAPTKLPPMAATTTGLEREDPCPTCDRGGYFGTPDEPLMIVYDGDDLDVETIPDAAETYEHFGNSGIHERFEFSRLPSGRLLVRPPVLSVLLDAKIRGLRPYPVSIR